MIFSLSHVFKSYFQGDLETPVLKDINFSMEEGDYIAVMGPSGSGKSTLMNIIGCLDRQTEGTYLLDGDDVRTFSDDRLSEVRAEKIGFIFQSFQLLPYLSALENVALPMSYAGVPFSGRNDAALAMLERVGLEGLSARLPNQLSGGQKQRVAIARALVNHPKILLADEPTGALDSASGIQIMELFENLNREGTAILMITHDAKIAAHASRVVTIFDGRLGEGAAEDEEDQE